MEKSKQSGRQNVSVDMKRHRTQCQCIKQDRDFYYLMVKGTHWEKSIVIKMYAARKVPGKSINAKEHRNCIKIYFIVAGNIKTSFRIGQIK